MGKFYAVLRTYSPNTAATNRFMGLIKTLSNAKINTNVVFLSSDTNNSEAPDLPYIQYNYLWKKCNPRNAKLKMLFFSLIYSRVFCSKVKVGDTVYLYGCDEVVIQLAKKRGINVFQERAEHPLVSKLKTLNVKKYLRSCSKITGLFLITSALKEYYKLEGVPVERIHVINMTVDLARFKGLNKQPSERYIAYCGKATNNKDGVDRLIKAFAITAKTHSDVKLYIIGTPPKRADESGNIELVESLGISDKVVFTGVIPAEQVPQVLMNAEILALARPDNMQAKYGFPTKLGEYLLTGNPVVITSVGDMPLFLKNGESALLADASSIKDFASKLNWALDNPDRASFIGQNGKSIAMNYFNSEIESTKMIRLMKIQKQDV